MFNWLKSAEICACTYTGNAFMDSFRLSKKFFVFFIILFFDFAAFGAGDVDLKTSISKAKVACSGISNAMHDLKVKAGINTAVTGVGTVTGGVALGTGIAKASVDKEYDKLVAKVKNLIAEKSNIPVDEIDIEDVQAFEVRLSEIADGDYSDIPADVKKIGELEQKSKTLGKVRTGTLAVSTVTNVAGTAIAATNKVNEDLEEKIKECISATKELSNVKLSAKVEETATETELNEADKIISACRDYEYIDLKPINKRAMGTAISSGIGAGTGVVGTITSGIANNDKTRRGDDNKEKSLNTISNVMAGASTVASATATILNATQISAIKKVAIVADECEGALK